MGGACPPLSVVMPVHNGLPYLDESIASILGQSFADFEFVILDDGSTDETGTAAREWQRKDHRVRLIVSPRRLGLAGSSNLVVAGAKAAVVARMDADDRAHPDRLRRQWEVLQARPDAQLVGTLWEGIDRHGRRIRPRDRWRLVRRSSFAPFPHASTMFRRAAFRRIGGYRETCVFWEDLDFFIRIGTIGRILVLPDVLHYYRFHPNSSRLMSRAEMEKVENAVGLMYRCVAERRDGRDFGPLLHETADGRFAGRLPPGVFTSIGSARLWAGEPPGVLGALWRRGALGWNFATAVALSWAAWGELSPSTLRLTLRGITRVRDLVAGRRLNGGAPREWHFA